MPRQVTVNDDTFEALQLVGQRHGAMKAKDKEYLDLLDGIAAGIKRMTGFEMERLTARQEFETAKGAATELVARDVITPVG